MAEGLFGFMGLSVVGMAALLVTAIVVQVVALYMATTFAGLLASPGRAFLAFLETVVLSLPALYVLGGVDVSINVDNALSSLINLVAGTVAVKHLYNTGFGLALLSYGLAVALTLAALSTAFLVIF